MHLLEWRKMESVVGLHNKNCHLLIDFMQVLVNILLWVDHIIISFMINHRPKCSSCQLVWSYRSSRSGMTSFILRRVWWAQYIRDILEVLGDAVVACSVDQTLKGKHWQSLRCLSAWNGCLPFQLLNDKSVHPLYDVQEKLNILGSSGSFVEKEWNWFHDELMDLNEVNDLFTDTFLSVIMSDMTEY